MDELSVYRYQLEQVQLSLAEDPGNEELIKLSKDLEEAIALTAELQEPSRPAAKKSSSRTQAEARAQAQSPSSSPSMPLPYSASKSPPLAKPEWKLGDYCEIKLPEYSHQWMEAVITSLSSDRSLVTLVVQKTHETRHVPTQEIRPSLRGGSPGASLLAGEPNAAAFASAAGHDSAAGRAKRLVENAAEIRKKRLRSRQDYIDRKEAEHSTKQQSWQSFQSKLVKKATPSLFKSKYTSNDSLFKSPEEGSIGGKVGVVNSGRPMTVIALPKKIKPIFSHSHDPGANIDASSSSGLDHATYD